MWYTVKTNNYLMLYFVTLTTPMVVFCDIYLPCGLVVYPVKHLC